MSRARPALVAAAVALLVVSVVAVGEVLLAGRDDEPPTTLQLRPVLGQAEGCRDRAGDENPPPSKSASLSHNGRCIGLGPSLLTVSRAGVSPPADRGGRAAVQINLAPADARTLADVTADYLGEQVAVVAFGRVVVAPVVQQPVDSGQIELSGLSHEEARELRAAFTAD